MATKRRTKPKQTYVTEAERQARRERTHQQQIARAVRQYKDTLRKWRRLIKQNPELDRHDKIAHRTFAALDVFVQSIGPQLRIIDELRGHKPCSEFVLQQRITALLATPR